MQHASHTSFFNRLLRGLASYVIIIYYYYVYTRVCIIFIIIIIIRVVVVAGSVVGRRDTRFPSSRQSRRGTLFTTRDCGVLVLGRTSRGFI